jgi:hypothetical protein
LQGSAQAGTRIRYGFVPYSTNVNVGGLLADDWVVQDWKYQSRELASTITSIVTFTYYTSSTYVSGTITSQRHSTYAASYSEANGWYCPTRPTNSVTTTSTSSTTTEAVIGPPAGVRSTTTYVRTRNGDAYSVTLADTTCVVTQTRFIDYVDTYKRITEPALGSDSQWRYGQLDFDVSNWRSEGNGCIEERATYPIGNYDNVDFARALDLDLDRVPSADDPATQWRPMYPALVYARSLKWDGSGSFTRASVTTSAEFVAPHALGTAACPAPAMKLAELTRSELDEYLASLRPVGSTYHDIGMIWGGRLISPTGLFAAENVDTSPNSPTSRHLIFLTDGETAPYDLSYSSYGIEPLDARRWEPGSAYSLTQTVENRFAVACREVKKRNITVWVIGFGTTLSDFLKDCAGNGHYFEAADAAELNATFAAIAKNMSRLRIER